MIPYRGAHDVTQDQHLLKQTSLSSVISDSHNFWGTKKLGCGVEPTFKNASCNFGSAVVLPSGRTLWNVTQHPARKAEKMLRDFLRRQHLFRKGMSSLKEQGRHETRSCFSRLSKKVFCFREEIWIFEHTKKNVFINTSSCSLIKL